MLSCGRRSIDEMLKFIPALLAAIFIIGVPSTVLAQPWAGMAEDLYPEFCEKGCDGVCNSGLEYDTCGICGGDGSVCVNECSLFQVDIHDGGRTPDGIRISGQGGDHYIDEGEDFSKFGCFHTLFDDIIGVCTDIGYNNLPGTTQHPDRYLNDCYATALMYAGNQVDFLTAFEQEKARQCSARDIARGGNPYRVCMADTMRQMRPGRHATVFFDNTCQGVDDPTSAEQDEACSGLAFWWKNSPISLLWNSKVDIELNKTAVAFPLDPFKKGKYYTWKASADAPLLVYDPEHTGKITSAKQLFGDWTFGGKRLASASHQLRPYIDRKDLEAQVKWGKRL